MPIGKNDEIAQQFHPNMVFSITDFQEKKMEVFNQLPEGIRNIILKSKELEGTEKQDLGDENNAQDLGDIPF
jgi:hypothetical protein